MSIEVKSLDEYNAYPFFRDELRQGQFAECADGTFVIVARNDNYTNNPINLTNGCGGYGPKDKFRVLSFYEVTIKTTTQKGLRRASKTNQKEANSEDHYSLKP